MIVNLGTLAFNRYFFIEPAISLPLFLLTITGIERARFNARPLRKSKFRKPRAADKEKGYMEKRGERESTRAACGADCERHATIAAIDRVIETRYAVYGKQLVGYRSTLRMDMIP